MPNRQRLGVAPRQEGKTVGSGVSSQPTPADGQPLGDVTLAQGARSASPPGLKFRKERIYGGGGGAFREGDFP